MPLSLLPPIDATPRLRPSHVAPVAVETLRGRLTEIAAGPEGGTSSVAATWVAMAQRADEPVAWVQWEFGELYPPDLAARGIDLEALLVVHVGERHVMPPRLRAAELLLKSGGFGLVVVDMTAGQPPRGVGWQHRLQHWARTQNCALVLLCAHPEPVFDSLGALVALQIIPQRHQVGPGLFELNCSIGKNKLEQGLQGWRATCTGPPGFR
jgi:recombination protein RecA